MATQLATTEETGQRQLPAKVPVASGGKLAAFVPQTLEEAWRLAAALAASGMTPKAYGTDQNKIMVGIMAGAEVGLTPFAALQSIAVIGNNPSLWGDGALALVQASGLLDDMEEVDDGDTATCRLNRKGRSTPIVRTFSMEDAKKAGLSGKTGPWSQYPARMRQMRARAFALRDGFSDVLKGLHIAEEVRDYTPMGMVVPTSTMALTGQMLIDQSQPVTLSAVPAHDSGTGEIISQSGDAQAERQAEFDAASAAAAELNGQGDFSAGDDAPHPAQARADEIIAEYRGINSIMDLNSAASRARADVDAMPDEIAAIVSAEFQASKDRINAAHDAARRAERRERAHHPR